MKINYTKVRYNMMIGNTIQRRAMLQLQKDRRIGMYTYKFDQHWTENMMDQTSQQEAIYLVGKEIEKLQNTAYEQQENINQNYVGNSNLEVSQQDKTVENNSTESLPQDTLKDHQNSNLDLQQQAKSVQQNITMLEFELEGLESAKETDLKELNLFNVENVEQKIAVLQEQLKKEKEKANHIHQAQQEEQQKSMQEKENNFEKTIYERLKTIFQSFSPSQIRAVLEKENRLESVLGPYFSILKKEYLY